MIKWLKRKIEIHNAKLDYGNYEEHWEFESWMLVFIIGIALCVAGLYVGFTTTIWKLAIPFIVSGILLMLYLCCQIKLFSKTDIENYNDENFDPYNIDNLQFIWGVKSWDELSSGEANLHTMNDIDIIYDTNTKLYSLDIETIYHFNGGKMGEVKYLNYLFEKFTEYMEKHNLNKNEPYDFQAKEPHIILKAKSIPELYTSFRIFVAGYNAVYGGKQNETICDI